MGMGKSFGIVVSCVVRVVSWELQGGAWYWGSGRLGVENEAETGKLRIRNEL